MGEVIAFSIDNYAVIDLFTSLHVCVFVCNTTRSVVGEGGVG